MEIIPAIDIIGGKCVRLTQGDYQQKKEYSSQPLEVAQRLEQHGIRRLHLVDLDGAQQKKVVNDAVLNSITTHTQLQVDFGGGVHSAEDLQRVFNAGAHQVTIGSIAAREPDTFMKWLEHYGADKIILGADTRDRKVSISGWQEQAEVDVVEFIQDYQKRGVQYVICTDVTKDGMLEGPSFPLYKEIANNVPDVHLIASGGVATVQDLRILEKLNVYGVIIGKALYEEYITLPELEEFL